MPTSDGRKAVPTQQPAAATESDSVSAPILLRKGPPMTNTKFVVKVNRVGRRTVEYVQRIDATPLRTTTNLKLALAMGKFTAEDVVKSIANSRCKPELISVQVVA